MRILATKKNGSSEAIEVTGPLRIIEHPSGTLQILHDESTGHDYWFNIDGTFDGVGFSVADLSLDEAKAVMTGLTDKGSKS